MYTILNLNFWNENSFKIDNTHRNVCHKISLTTVTVTVDSFSLLWLSYSWCCITKYWHLFVLDNVCVIDECVCVCKTERECGKIASEFQVFVENRKVIKYKNCLEKLISYSFYIIYCRYHRYKISYNL